MAIKIPLPMTNLNASDVRDTIGIPSDALNRHIVAARADATMTKNAFRVVEDGFTSWDGDLADGETPYWNVFSPNSPGEWVGSIFAKPDPISMFGSMSKFRLKRNKYGNITVGGVLFNSNSYCLDYGAFAGYNHNAPVPRFSSSINQNGISVQFNPHGIDWLTAVGGGGYCVEVIRNNGYAGTMWLTHQGNGLYTGAMNHNLSNGSHSFVLRLGTSTGGEDHGTFLSFGEHRQTVVVTPITMSVNIIIIESNGSRVLGYIIREHEVLKTSGYYDVEIEFTERYPYTDKDGDASFLITYADNTTTSGPTSPATWNTAKNMTISYTGSTSTLPTLGKEIKSVDIIITLN